jgi:hypothetical protein
MEWGVIFDPMANAIGSFIASFPRALASCLFISENAISRQTFLENKSFQLVCDFEGKFVDFKTVAYHCRES